MGATRSGMRGWTEASSAARSVDIFKCRGVYRASGARRKQPKSERRKQETATRTLGRTLSCSQKLALRSPRQLLCASRQGDSRGGEKNVERREEQPRKGGEGKACALFLLLQEAAASPESWEGKAGVSRRMSR
jgi:hypothetical protein